MVKRKFISLKNLTLTFGSNIYHPKTKLPHDITETLVLARLHNFPISFSDARTIVGYKKSWHMFYNLCIIQFMGNI